MNLGISVCHAMMCLYQQVASLQAEYYQVICHRWQEQMNPAPQGAMQVQDCVQDEEL